MRAAWHLVVLFWASTAWAQSDLIARCETANPAFPQLCPCAVEAGFEAGISAPDLKRLLSNDFIGVSTEAVTAWAPIYASCTSQAVNAELGVPPVSTEVAPVPVVTPDPTPSTAAQATAAAPVTFTLSLTDPGRPTGTWGNVALERSTEMGMLLIGAQSDEGPILGLRCRTSHGTEFPHIMLGPFADGPATLRAILTVEARTPFRRGVPLQRLEGGLYAGALYEDMAQAFAGGNVATFDLGALGKMTVGLRGSSREIGDQFSCGGRPGLVRGFAHPQTTDILFEGAWARAEERLGIYDQPVLAFPSAHHVGANIRISCEGQVLFAPNVTSYPLPLPGAVQYERDGSVVTHRFTFDLRDDSYIASEPLDRSVLLDMAEAEAVLFYFNADFDPGADFDAIYSQNVSTRGLAEGLADLACNEIAPIPPNAAIDLTASDGTWHATDFADLNGSSEPVPTAIFSGDGVAPNLMMYCGAAPFFWADAFETQGRVDVRFVVDGDTANAVQTDYTYYRSLRHTNWQNTEPLADRILAGTSLRVTVLQERAVDVLYPLDGLADALRAAGCSS